APRGPAEARAVPQGPAGPAGRTGRPGGADARQGQGRQGRCQGEDGQGAGEAEGAARGGGQALRGPQGGRQGHLGRPDPTDGQGARAAQEGRRRGQGPLQISGRPENRESFLPSRPLLIAKVNEAVDGAQPPHVRTATLTRRGFPSPGGCAPEGSARLPARALLAFGSLLDRARAGCSTPQPRPVVGRGGRGPLAPPGRPGQAEEPERAPSARADLAALGCPASACGSCPEETDGLPSRPQDLPRSPALCQPRLSRGAPACRP